MEKPEKSQIAKISLIALLFLITPLLSTSMRPPYLYFLLNLLIIALGAEAGLLSFLTPSNHEKLRNATVVAPKPLVLVPPLPASSSSSSSSGAAPVKEVDHNKKLDAVMVTKNVNTIESSSNINVVAEKVIKIVSTTVSSKSPVKAHNNVKKCPSMPSLFFIGGGEGDDITDEEDEWEEDQEEEEEEMEGTPSGQELFTKAETFIGNFYKQLKIQREESWKRIHGFYQKAF